MRAELVDPVEWEQLTAEIDGEFGEGVSKGILGERQPFALINGETREVFLVPPDWIKYLAMESNQAPDTFDLRFAGKHLGTVIKGRLRLGLQIVPEMLRLTQNILEVSGRGAEAFTYGRSIIKESVVRLHPSLKRGQRVLVVNKDKDCMGIASLSIDAIKVDRLAPDRLVGKNLADVGWYIRKLG